MKNISFIILIVMTLYSCRTDNNTEKEQANTDPILDTLIVTKEIIQTDSLSIANSEIFIERTALEKLKSIVDSNILIEKKIESIIISDKDSIKSFYYISGLFDVEKIDSIEIYGVLPRTAMLKRYLPMNSLAILYSSDDDFTAISFDSLNTRTHNGFRIIERIFKPGGIAFSLDENICLYSVNACGPGFKQIKKTDSNIKEKIFNGQPFYRLQSGCGMGRMIVKNN
ncbi:MAG: hypothetical protein ACI87N_002046 [Flavobacteriales bacterium]|jgi:hypothetical protein